MVTSGTLTATAVLRTPLLSFLRCAAFIAVAVLSCACAAVADASVDFARRVAVPTEEQPTVTAVADVTGDAIPDLLSGSSQVPDLMLHAGLGGGRFASGVGIPVGDTVLAIATGDFDEDGDRDIVTANVDRSLRLLFMDGHGVVTRTATITVGGSPTAIAQADLNADGHVDLVVVNSESRNASVLIGRGAAGFDASAFTDIGDFAVDATLADVTDDGRLDIVAAVQRPAGVTITAGNGDGTFARPRRMRAGLEPASVGVADIDRNGFPDILTANQLSNEITLQRGIGGGRFVPGRRSLTSNFPVDMILGDWNADGLIDVATANSGSNDVSVLEGDGRGRFRPARQFQVGRSPASITSGDATGDGVPDLVVAHGGGDSIAILSPRPLRPPGTAKRRARCPATRLRAVSAIETRCVTLTMTPIQVIELLGRPRGSRLTDGGTSLRWHYNKLLVTFSRKLNIVTAIRTLYAGARTSNGITVGTFVGDLERRIGSEFGFCTRSGVIQTCSEVSLFTVTQYQVVRGRVAWIEVALAVDLFA